ncbi:MAG TPA: hypothetical protein VEK34_13875 [Methylocella sp.]|nr:hypothetical protein [Methylocella sp.]
MTLSQATHTEKAADRGFFAALMEKSLIRRIVGVVPGTLAVIAFSASILGCWASLFAASFVVPVFLPGASAC